MAQSSASSVPQQSFEMGAFARMNNQLSLTHCNCTYADHEAKQLALTETAAVHTHSKILIGLKKTLRLHTECLSAAVASGNVGTDCEEPLECGSPPLEYHYMNEVPIGGQLTDSVKILPSEVLARAICELSSKLTHEEEVAKKLYEAKDRAWEMYNSSRTAIWAPYKKLEDDARVLSTSFWEFNQESWKVFASIYPWFKLTTGVCKFHLRHKLNPKTYATGCQYGSHCRCAHMSTFLPKLD